MRNVLQPPRIVVVACKGCKRVVPAGLDALPVKSVRVDCPACGEKRMYRAIEPYLGRADCDPGKKTVERAALARAWRDRRRA